MAKQSKSKAKRKTSAWFQRHANDPHVKQAQREGKRSRAAFKLTEVLNKYSLLERKDHVIIDLGCAPGSWSEELAHQMGKDALVIGVDLIEMQPIYGVHFLQGDFTDAGTLLLMDELLAGRRVDIVLSDMSPEMCGNKLVDQARTISLNDAALDFSINHLREGGHLLLKSFMGDGFDTFKREMNGWFTSVRVVKPAASRKSSSEIYLLGQQFRR